MKFFFLSLFFSPLFASFSTSNHVESAILMNMETGKILYEKKAYERRFPASVTKIATALFALDQYKPNLDRQITIESFLLKTASMQEKRKSPERFPSYTLEPDGSTISLLPGEVISLRTLFYGLMLGSGNDAANAIAYTCTKDLPMFIADMNQYLKKIGCKDTHFTNPHGLHSLDHYTTAYDLAIMTKKAMTLPLFSQIVKSITYQREDTNKQKSFTITQTNRLIKPGPFYYPKAIGVKTGYTSNAGYNLVSAASNGERHLIAVLLGSKVSDARYLDAASLFETAFNEQKIHQRLYAQNAEIFKNEIKGGNCLLKASLTENIDIDYYPSEPIEVNTSVRWFDKSLPIKPGICVGMVEVTDKQSHRLLVRKELYSQNTVDYTYGAKAIFTISKTWQFIVIHKLMIILSAFMFAMALFIAKRSARQKIK